MPTKIYQPSWTQDTFTNYIPPDLNLLQNVYKDNQQRADKITDGINTYQLEMAKQQLNAVHDQFKQERLGEISQKIDELTKGKQLTDPIVQRQIEGLKNKYINDDKWLNAVRSTKEAEAMQGFLEKNPHYINTPWLLNLDEHNKYLNGESDSYHFSPPKAYVDVQKNAQDLVSRLNVDETQLLAKYGANGIYELAKKDKSAKVILDKLQGATQEIYSNTPSLKGFLEGRSKYEGGHKTGDMYWNEAIQAEAQIQGNKMIKQGLPHLDPNAGYNLSMMQLQAAKTKAQEELQKASSPIFTPVTHTQRGVDKKGNPTYLKTYQVTPDGIGAKIIKDASQQVENNQKPITAHTNEGKMITFPPSLTRSSVFDNRVIQTGPKSIAFGNVTYMNVKEAIKEVNKQGFDVSTAEELKKLIPNSVIQDGQTVNGQLKNSPKYSKDDVIIAFKSEYEGASLRDPNLHKLIQGNIDLSTINYNSITDSYEYNQQTGNINRGVSDNLFKK